jgi:hypothetical protein
MSKLRDEVAAARAAWVAAEAKAAEAAAEAAEAWAVAEAWAATAKAVEAEAAKAAKAVAAKAVAAVAEYELWGAVAGAPGGRWVASQLDPVKIYPIGTALYVCRMGQA